MYHTILRINISVEIMVNLYQITERPYRNITNPFVIRKKSRKSASDARNYSGYKKAAGEDRQGMLINYVTRVAERSQHPAF
ncbi:hypothetical protein AYY18_00095 [Morganella psychrotolerans]|uniref:Uncharacterized protein n=1 Tax=Morganella psychrotolerans TaxID=368603 RepID=A0A1B8HTI7_9GAMM|nr:hypothetical protein AYY18_00095 [Morganella psychrotolerans]